jgi:NADH:ubiquinone oxidoreductase subunit E
VVCLGSSCFARGNSENLALINNHVQSHGLKAAVRLTGKLCQDECMQGPNLSIGGEIYHGITTARLVELLQQLGRT